MTPGAQQRAEGRYSASRLWERALDLLFPPRCVACRSFGAFLCDSCLAATAPAQPPRCPVCWMPQTGGSGTCHRCRRRPPAFRAARAAYVYEGPVREAVHALKYDGVAALAPLVGRLIADRLLEWSPPVDAVVPVPLAGQRLRQRGYNQSQLLAREVARRAGLRLETRALRRTRAGLPQARQPDEDARRAAVAGAFAHAQALAGSAVLLVDDVMTTGATLDACARVLLDAGAEAVFAITFARED